MSVPSGQYTKKVLAKNHFLYNDNMLTPTSINGNYSGLNAQVIENLPITETAYYNNILDEFKNIACAYPYGGDYNQPGQNIRWKDSLIPIKLYTDSVDAPSGWAAQADSAIADITGSITYNKVKFNIAPNDSSFGISIKYVPDSQMSRSGVAGWTDIAFDSNNNPIKATCYISTTYNSVQSVMPTMLHEFMRAFGCVYDVPVPISYMNETGNWTPTLPSGDGLVLAIMDTLRNGTNAGAYTDVVTTSIDLPPSRPMNVSPVDKDTLVRSGETFSWDVASGSKPASYTFTLFGNGQTITKTTSNNSVSLDSVAVASLKPSSMYSWTVSVSDGFYPVQYGDTSSVITPVKINSAPSTFAYSVSPDTITAQE